MPEEIHQIWKEKFPQKTETGMIGLFCVHLETAVQGRFGASVHYLAFIVSLFVSEAERQHRNTFLEEEKVIHDSVSITAILILIFYFFIINKNSFISFCHLKPFKGRFRFFHFERTKVYI